MSEKDSANQPRLIEVDFPLKEVSAESVREKNIRHGHISTLHIWWAWAPLAASWLLIIDCQDLARRVDAFVIKRSPAQHYLSLSSPFLSMVIWLSALPLTSP